MADMLETGTVIANYVDALPLRNLSDDEKRAAANREYVKNLETLLAERDRLLEAIPPCPIHGSQCVPHALWWIEVAKPKMLEAHEIEAEWERGILRMENAEMGEPIKLYRNGEMIMTTAPSVAREWQAQGWKLQPDMMPNAAPDELPEMTPEPEHWAADMINHVEPEPVQSKRKPGRPKKA